MRLLFAAVVLASAVASAQPIITLALDGQTNSTPLVKPADACEDILRLTWTVTNFPLEVCDDFVVWATTATSCPDRPAATDLELDRLTQTELLATQQGTLTTRVRELPIFTAEQVCPAPIEASVRFCASLEFNNNQFGGCNDQFADAQTSPQLTYDALPPAAPTISGITPLDEALSVSVILPDGASIVVVEYAPAGTTDFLASPATTGTTVRIDGLQNNQPYDVRARALDAAGNRSDPSPTVQGTPVLTQGYFERYRAAGGQEDGGCSSSGGGLALLGAALALALGAVRRKGG